MKNPHERLRDKWKKIKKKVIDFFDRILPARVQSWLEGVLLIIVAIVVACASYKFVGYLIDRAVENEVLKTFAEAMDGYIEAAVAAISAGFVVLQLKNGTKQEKHQADVEEAEFILEYNKSFTENQNLTEIERYLECKMTGVDYGVVKNLEDHRQDMVNYLVYLEGLASCIHSGVLRFERIDDLLAYRFFIAMNQIEAQAIDLLPYAAYYRGSFRLYEAWLAHRITCNKYTEEENWEIPLFATALCNHYGYEKYAIPEMELTVKKEEEGNGLIFKARIPRKGWVELHLDAKNHITIKHARKAYKESPVYRSLLRRILKEFVYVDEHEKDLLKDILKFEKITKDKDILEQFQSMAKAPGFDKITGDAYAEKLLADLKYTKAILLAREQSKQGVLQFRQLHNDEKDLSEQNLKEIAELIYGTDKYISEDMFGNKRIAAAVLPKLFKGTEDEMFQKKNLFICQVSGHILGAILWYEGVLDWSKAALEAELEKYIKEHAEEDNPGRTTLLEKLEQVSKQYMKNYAKKGSEKTDHVPADIVVLNLCTNPDVRGMRIASEMLQAFLAQHKKETIELCVLSKNTSAVKLYTKNGFMQIREEDAYPKRRNHKRLVMRRPKEKKEQKESPIRRKMNRLCCCRKAKMGGAR